MKKFKIENELFSLADTQALGKENPDTFEVETLEILAHSIKETIKNDREAFAKLIFNHKGTNHSERMWVIITEFNEESKVITGVLNNEPLTKEVAEKFAKNHGIPVEQVGYFFGGKLECDDEVEFELTNVAMVL